MDKNTEQKELLARLNEIEPTPASIVFMVLHKVEDGQTNIDADIVQAIMDVIERPTDIDWHYELP